MSARDVETMHAGDDEQPFPGLAARPAKRQQLDRLVGLVPLKDYLLSVEFSKIADTWTGVLWVWISLQKPSATAGYFDSTTAGAVDPNHVVSVKLEARVQLADVRAHLEELKAAGKTKEAPTDALLDRVAKRKILKVLTHLLTGQPNVVGPLTEADVAAGFSFGNFFKSIGSGIMKVAGPIAKMALSTVVGPGIANAAFGVIEGVANGSPAAEQKVKEIGQKAKEGDPAAVQAAKVLKAAEEIRQQALTAQKANAQAAAPAAAPAGGTPPSNVININTVSREPKASEPLVTRYQPPPLASASGDDVSAGGWFKGFVQPGARG